LILAVAGIASSAGALVLAVQLTRKDVNGLGQKLGALDKREERRHKQICAALFESSDAASREIARRLLLD